MTEQFTVVHSDDKRLVIHACPEAIEWARGELAAGKDEAQIFWEAFEHYWANGRFQPCNDLWGAPHLALWGGPCIAEWVDYSDEGGATLGGDVVWTFLGYEVRSPLDVLLRDGKVEFAAFKLER